MEDMDESIKRSSKYPFSEGILNRIGEAFSIEIPESEKKKFVQCLRRKSYLKSSTKNVDEIALPVIIGEAIYHISESFNISFYLDFGLYDVIGGPYEICHLPGQIRRISEKSFWK